MDDLKIGQEYTTASGRVLRVVDLTEHSVFYREVLRSGILSATARRPTHEFRRIVGI